MRKDSLSLQIYDDFSQPGYALSNYAEKWMNPNGLGEVVFSRSDTP